MTAEELLIEPRPEASDEQIHHLLKNGWNVTGSFELLAGERDQNLRVATTDGRIFILKIYNRMELPLVRSFQHELLQRCARQPGLCVPELIPALNGGPEIIVEIDGDAYGAVLMSFIGGTSPAAQVGPRFRHGIGRASGAIALALADYDHPCAQRAMWWNHMALPELVGLVDLIPQPEHRAWIADHIALFEAEIGPRARDLPQQVIHNDLNPSNIRVDPEDSEQILGIIDFGDAVRAPRINELAVCSNYFITPETGVAQCLAEIVSGYESFVELTEAEIELLPHLVCSRLATRILLTHWRHSRFPQQGDYILRNLANAWRTLDMIRGLDPAEISLHIKQMKSREARA